ncbi:hypothetical protein MK805_06370 [Shimazuella sp. AN120528]|jgi:hypothetical protein|uniref:hypothetical protein n=1 Tax=Shimazuella TaxID=471798 RepID=UPI0004139FA1|nr:MULTISPECIES: hypothetical protein [Shimazuella]MCH5584593.1 hypothetical protein [Shimazuella soli]
MARKNKNILLDEDLYKEVKALAAIQKERTYTNDLIEEGMRLVLIKYGVRKEKNEKKEE